MEERQRNGQRCSFATLLRGAGWGILGGLGTVCAPIYAAPQPGSFASWCLHQAQLTAAQQQTISAILASVNTTDCQQAEQILTTQPGLILGSKDLTDLSPVTTLPHLRSLDLSHNQIQDLSPLQTLKQLHFLLLSGNQIQDVQPLAALPNLGYVVLENNQIQDVSALATLKQLTVLNLLDNPLTKKICPVKPVTPCLFSDAGKTLYAQAEQYYQAGQFQTALPLFEQALSIYQGEHDLRRQGETLNRLGDIRLNLGQYPQALEQYQAALSLQRQIEDTPGLGVSLTSLAAAYERLGQYAKAQERATDAIANLQSQNPSRLDGAGVYEHAKEEGLLYHRLARIQSQQNNAKAALSSLNHAEKIYQNLPAGYPGKSFGERRFLETQGVAYLKQGKAAEALEALTAALTIARQNNNQAGAGSTLNHLGEVYLSQRNTEKAYATFLEAFNIQSEILDQPGMGLTAHNMGLTLLKARHYQKASATLLLAVEIWEKLRPGLADEQKVALFETQADTYTHLQTALLAQGKHEAALTIAERGRTRAFVELLVSRLEAKGVQPVPPSIEELKQIARAQDATLVEYSILQEQLSIWVISPSGILEQRTVDLTQQSLPDLIQATQKAMGVSDRGSIRVVSMASASRETTQSPLRQLHQLLIDPIADLLPKDPEQRVVFIPHRALFLVPFPALQGADGPLIEKHTLSSAPSIQLLAFTQGQRPTKTDKNLVVGNPIMPSILVGTEQQALIPLPGAEREAVAIASLLNTQALIGAKATEATVVEQMAAANTIHLATHGLLDELSLDTPGAIALTPSFPHRPVPSSPPNPAPSETDGFLTTSEILNLKLKANLVVLSACNTGIGKITGDGVVGLARAFMAAGAPSVVVSLWSVPDAPTAELMTEFYRQQQQGLDKAQALRQAMLATRKRHPHPKDWAAFTLMGEAR
ncbi:MAG: leucine-rich repeat protein [Thermosynechococcaceae cyanobacterium]